MIDDRPILFIIIRWYFNPRHFTADIKLGVVTALAIIAMKYRTEVGDFCNLTAFWLYKKTSLILICF